ncbi:MAG: cytochrome c biogenesis protein CcdA [Kiritimatiellae bacterium]|nr:cytochrome c biogenesis protein CcdA [Kiritimatiellia bacterium]
MKKTGTLFAVLFQAVWLAFSAIAADESFLFDAVLVAGEAGETRLAVQAGIPAGHKLYADQFRVEAAAPYKIIPLSLPAPRKEQDVLSGGEKQVYDRSFTAVYLVENFTNGPVNIKISYQGCDQAVCFLPAEKKISLDPTRSPPELKTAVVAMRAGNEHPEWLSAFKRNYKIAAVRSGYMSARDFLSFLDSPAKSKAEPDSIQKTWRSGRVWISMFLMILGGLALNLTPCVLPLIPVNLAIIGAGIRTASARQGFLRGMLYGLGIVLAYGGLGLATVLTGAQFGALNASGWFNLAVAAVFLILGLALLDAFMIDFSRFQNRFHLKKGQGMFFIPFLGAVSALLAGACVAPVVIAVLLLATDLYAQGQAAGLFMPFFLGLGMALPWPFAGAGLSFLPKPGKWMARVKHVFAAVILLASVYYFYMGAKLLSAGYNFPADAGRGAAALVRDADGKWLDFPEGLAAADREQKPVLIYFWATWCKSCRTMSATTLKYPLVEKRMNDFILIKYDAENPADEATKTILREFGVLGLPTFVVLSPAAQDG